MDMEQVRGIVELALAEDLGAVGDITTDAVVDATVEVKARLIAKRDGVICGLPVAALVFEKVDDSIVFEPRVGDGSQVAAGAAIGEVSGPARGILAAERTALNLLQHMSGIATVTAEAVARAAGTPARIYDTRKTEPGIRCLEKYAIALAGGFNHRAGLYDGVLIKDNHIAVAGGISRAIAVVRSARGDSAPIEVETESLAEVQEALAADADAIMLDNMDAEQIADAVRLIAGRVVVEASGGIGLEDVEEIAATGVDRISMGALTDAPRLDISLEIVT